VLIYASNHLSAKAENGGITLNPLSILIADDEELTLLDLKEMLESEGYIVCGEAHSGKEAIELAKKLSPI